ALRPKSLRPCIYFLMPVRTDRSMPSTSQQVTVTAEHRDELPYQESWTQWDVLTRLANWADRLEQPGLIKLRHLPRQGRYDYVVAQLIDDDAGLAHLQFHDRQNVVYAAIGLMPSSRKSSCMPMRMLS